MLSRLFPLVLVLVWLNPGAVWAAECTDYWDTLLSTDSLTAKGLSGDTHAAYGVLSFRGDPSTKYIVRGEFPNARFMSLSTVTGKKHHPIDAIEDYRMVPDTGSLNPFHEGVQIDTPNRSFTLEVLPKGVPSSAANIVRLPSDREVHSLMYRIFSPNRGYTVTQSSFPRVFAFDVESGAPKACPEHHLLPTFFRFPQFLTVIVPRKIKFAFKLKTLEWGPNSAIPQYAYAVNPTKKDKELTVIRFKAPSYADTVSGTGAFHSSAEVRYWSFCVQNFPKNETLACVADYNAKVGAGGMVTVVVGGNDEVKGAAEAQGFNYLEDTRAWNQFVIGFAYRNVLPTKEFAKNSMHKGEYLPKAVLCRERAFLSGKCEENRYQAGTEGG